jgi:hypothetical protein
MSFIAVTMLNVNKDTSSGMWRRVVCRVNFRRVYNFRVTFQLASNFSDTPLKTSNSASHHSTWNIFEICHTSRVIRRQPWNSVTCALFLLAPCHLSRQLTLRICRLTYLGAWTKGSVVSASTDFQSSYQLHQCRVFFPSCHNFRRRLSV